MGKPTLDPAFVHRVLSKVTGIKFYFAGEDGEPGETKAFPSVSVPTVDEILDRWDTYFEFPSEQGPFFIVMLLLDQVAIDMLLKSSPPEKRGEMLKAKSMPQGDFSEFHEESQAN